MALSLCSELWVNSLPNHSLFRRLREQLDPREGARGPAKNLTFCLGGDLFVWDDADRVFYTTDLRQLNAGGEEGSGAGSSFQTLLCINPPLFELHQVLLSPTQQHVALVGQRGVSVLELPQRWGKRSEFEGGRSRINCKTVPVAERFFTSSPSVVLRQASWFPSETEEPHLVLLTSDNTVRFYGLKSPQTPAKVLSVSQCEEDVSGHPPLRSYAASLGEIAVALDFGSASAQQVYPLYILYENGETYVSYTSQTSAGGGVSATKPAGPLPMYPAAEDNYGYDACAILCLPCVPSILVIATETGTLYHCVVLESEEDEEERFLRGAAQAVPALYVFECVELELTLKMAPGDDEEAQEQDFTCPMRLHRDPLCPQRYHCSHEAGVHSVGLIWITKLQHFLRSADEQRDELQELAADKRCIVEHILCTRPLPTSRAAPVRGFLIVSDLSLGATMICITSSYDCILLPLLSSIRPPSPPLLCSGLSVGGGGIGGIGGAASSPLRGLANNDDSFEKHIRNILARGSTNPLVLKAGGGGEDAANSSSPPPPECLQLLSRATQVFREEYILKQDLAREEMQRRVKLLSSQKRKQQEEMNVCRQERRSLREAAERLADKYEDAKYRQESIMKGVRRVLGALAGRLPVLSHSERDMKKELQSVQEQLRHLDTAIRQVSMKTQYQRTQVDKEQPESRAAVQLNAQQRKVVQDVLKEQGQQIQDTMRQIKDIKNHFSF